MSDQKFGYMNLLSQAAGTLENPVETPGSQMILKSPTTMATKPCMQKTLTLKPNPFCEHNSHIIVYWHNVGHLFGSLHVSLAHQ